MDGLHLTADLRDCAADRPVMVDTVALRTGSLSAVIACGLHPVGEIFHRYAAGGGITGVVLLAESHVAIHTWPELGAVTMDVYVCNFGADNSAKAEALLQALLKLFEPRAVHRQELRRGQRRAPSASS